MAGFLLDTNHLGKTKESGVDSVIRLPIAFVLLCFAPVEITDVSPKADFSRLLRVRDVAPPQ
jgi:hypothetical protein